MSAPSCLHVRADLSAYLDGDLDAGLTDAIRTHLDSCEACRAELGLLRLTVGALQRLPDLPPPAAILAGVRARLRPEPWYRRLLAGRRWRLGVPVGALATVLVIVGIAFFQARYPDITKTVTPGPFPRQPTPPAPQTQAKPTMLAPPAPAAALKDAFREESPRADSIAAAPAPGATPRPERVLERTVSIDEPAAARSAGAPTSPDHGSAVLDELSREAGTSTPPLDNKEKSSAVFARKADSGAELGRAKFAGAKASAGVGIEVVCLLQDGDDTVHDLERLLRREGAVDIEVSALEPPALRESFARQRGRFGGQLEPSRGWAMAARVPAPALARLLEVLAGRPNLRVLEKPAATAAPEDPAELLDLRITILR